MQVHENISLKSYNTFGIDVAAQYWAAIEDVQDLQEVLLKVQSNPLLVLGGGSNVLFTQDVAGWVLHNQIKGIEKVGEDEQFVYVRAGAGEKWHDLVLYSIAQNWGGMENLALIPGCVGASPMQNIGAYGVEIKDIFHELEAIRIADQQLIKFGLSDCAFGYRESVFKRKLKNQFIITHVTYRLRKTPVFNTSYGAIEQELEKMGIQQLSVKAIAQAVIQIRQSKLPDPAITGNAGSFFKNPSIDEELYTQLRHYYPAIVGYPNESTGQVKLAAGWLIEQCGWKGYRQGDAGCHAKQALVLVNHGHATGNQIFELSEAIIQSVKQKFGVELEREVNII